MRLVIFGPQGAGKGTQSARIAEKYGIPAISTGDIFRWAIKGQTSLGLKVQEFVDAGHLVPDDLTIAIIEERLDSDDCRPGFLLDGFPRNIAQAEALDGILAGKESSLDAAIAIEVPEEVSLRRLLGRRVCSECGRNYHVDSPPKNDWTCDACGGAVVERTDDHDEQTEPLKAYYRDRGLLREIDGRASPDEVFDRIVAAV